MSIKAYINKQARKAMNRLEDMKYDQSGESTIGSVIIAIIGMVIGAILISSLVPSSITSLETVNTTDWSTGAASTFGAVGTLVAVAALMIPVAIVIRLTQ